MARRRVRRRGLARLRHNERGAIVAITALLIIALLGMLALVVDVGSLFYRRVVLQNAADAAALAGALSCEQGEGAPEAVIQAGIYAVQDAGGASVAAGYPTFNPSCDAPAGTITVMVTESEQLAFAPVIGADSATVRTMATAAWGGAGAAENIAPLILSAYRLSNCEIPPPPGMEDVDRICSFWWNNSPRADIEDLTNAEWGTLDLDLWGVEVTQQCNNSTPHQFEEWMFDGFPSELPIYEDRPTYVCRGQGNFGAALDNMIDDAIAAIPELFLYFPVNDPTGQIDTDGVPCIPPELLDDPLSFEPCTVDKYSIIGFARLRILELHKGNTDEAQAACPDNWVRDANARCMVAFWEGYSSEGIDPEGGENFGIVPVTLVE